MTKLVLVWRQYSAKVWQTVHLYAVKDGFCCAREEDLGGGVGGWGEGGVGLLIV